MALVYPHSLAIEFPVPKYPKQAINIMTDHARKKREDVLLLCVSTASSEISKLDAISVGWKPIISFHFQIEK